MDNTVVKAWSSGWGAAIFLVVGGTIGGIITGVIYAVYEVGS